MAIGTIVRGGAADLNGDLRRGDEIHYVDRINVIGSTHRRVISLMGNAALAGEVTLGIHRNPARSESKWLDKLLISLYVVDTFSSKYVM